MSYRNNVQYSPLGTYHFHAAGVITYVYHRESASVTGSSHNIRVQVSEAPLVTAASVNSRTLPKAASHVKNAFCFRSRLHFYKVRGLRFIRKKKKKDRITSCHVLCRLQITTEKTRFEKFMFGFCHAAGAFFFLSLSQAVWKTIFPHCN